MPSNRCPQKRERCRHRRVSIPINFAAGIPHVCGHCGGSLGCRHRFRESASSYGLPGSVPHEFRIDWGFGAFGRPADSHLRYSLTIALRIAREVPASLTKSPVFQSACPSPTPDHQTRIVLCRLGKKSKTRNFVRNKSGMESKDRNFEFKVYYKVDRQLLMQDLTDPPSAPE